MKKFSIFNFQFSINKSGLIFLVLFIILGIVAFQIPVNVLEGAKVKFTLFDIYAPMTGAFLGSAIGVFAVLLMQSFNLLIHGFSGVQSDSTLKLIATMRFLPLILGTLYFAIANIGTTRKGFSLTGVLILVVPLLSIIAFVLHPIGRTVWYYSLFWLIPLAAWPIKNRFLLARALGSTFTAHAVGGAVWIWAFNLPSNVWISLIPVVALERAIFALGISASYILMNNVLSYLCSVRLILESFKIDEKYVLKSINHKP